jgi:phenylpyruvate tautomerase PptA (4-oxalocrotonate tautomerase family)
MPLIEIDALPQPPDVDTAEVTRELNRAVAAALGCRLDAVWTVWRTMTGPYARGEDVGFEQGRDTHGPIVHVYHHRAPEEVALVVETIERVLARELSLAPGNVFVTVQPVAFEEHGG